MSGHTVLRSTVFTLISTGILACADRAGPLEPKLTTLGSSTRIEYSKSSPAAKVLQRSKSLKSDIVVTTIVTPEGGKLAIDEAGLLVVFPRGAVSRRLAVTVKASRGKQIVYTFEPHGVRFNEPIIIAQLLGATTYSKSKGEARPALHGGYLPNGDNDVDANGMATFAETFAARYASRGRDSYVAFTTNHFSGYALASGRTNSGALDIPVDLP